MIDYQDGSPSNYGYVHTALSSSIVSHSTTGAFLGAGQVNLIVSKNASLEVYTFKDNQLELQCQIPTYIQVRKLLTVKTIFPTDLVFLVLDMFLVVAAFDFETKNLQPLYGEKILTRDQTDHADLLFTAYLPTEPLPKQFIAAYSGDGVFMHFNFTMDLSFSEDHGLAGTVTMISNDFIMDVGCDIVGSIFLKGGYTVGLIIRNTETRAISVRSYEIKPGQAKLVPGAILGTTDDVTTCVFAPSLTHDGLVTIGSKEINYFTPTGNISASFPNAELSDGRNGHTIKTIKACIALENNLFLYGDVFARWFLICIETGNAGQVPKLSRIELGAYGEFECCSKLSKIQHDHCLLAYDVYMGMTKTDSQLVSIIPTNPVGQQVKSHSKYSSFYATSVAVNATDSTIVGCSEQNNSLSILKNRIDVVEYARFEQNNVRAVWGLKQRLDDEYHSLLVFSFFGQTRVMRAGKDVTEVSIKAIRPDVETLFIGNARHGFIVHVTTQGISLLDVNFKIVHEWKVPNGVLSAATACMSQVTVSQGNRLYTFRIEQFGLILQSSVIQSDDVAFIIYEMDQKNQIGKTAFVALWRSNTVQCLSLPSLEKLSTIQLHEQSDSVIRCLALHNTDLMIGLGDGRVLHYVYNSTTHALAGGKTFQVGTTQARCASVNIPGIGRSYFFVCTDRPSLIITDEYGMRVVSVNLKVPIWYVCPFKFEFSNDWALVACSDTEVKVISLDNINKILPTKFDLKEFTPCNIDRFSPHNLYSVICAKNNGAYIRLIDIEQSIYHAQNQYFFTIDNDAEPLCISHLNMKSPRSGKLTDYLGAVTFTAETSTLSLYQIEKTAEGIFIVMERQSVQFEARVINMRCFKDMIILCCPESLILVNFNSDGDLDFVTNRDGFYFHNVASDPQSGLIVPLSLSTEIEIFEVEKNGSTKIQEVEIEQSGGDKSMMDMPLKVAILNGEHKQVVTGTMQGRLQFFFGPSNNSRKTRTIEYHLFDTVSSMNGTKDGNVIYTTQSGAVGVCKMISKEDYKVLSEVQRQMSERLKMLVPISHDEIRFNYSAVEDDEYLSKASLNTNLIDGDFVMKFLTLRKEQQEQIEKELNMNVTEYIQRFHKGLLFA